MPTARARTATAETGRPAGQLCHRWGRGPGMSVNAVHAALRFDTATADVAAAEDRPRVGTDAADAGWLAMMDGVAAGYRPRTAGRGPLRADRTPGACDVA